MTISPRKMSFASMPRPFPANFQSHAFILLPAMAACRQLRRDAREHGRRARRQQPSSAAYRRDAELRFD